MMKLFRNNVVNSFSVFFIISSCNVSCRFIKFVIIELLRFNKLAVYINFVFFAYMKTKDFNFLIITRTLPARISSSAFLLEQIPVDAMYLFKRGMMIKPSQMRFLKLQAFFCADFHYYVLPQPQIQPE